MFCIIGSIIRFMELGCFSCVVVMNLVISYKVVRKSTGRFFKLKFLYSCFICVSPH